MNKGLIIIFGASGDLSRRKLIPSLYQLFTQKILDQCHIIAAALESTTSQQLLEQIKPSIKNVDANIWDRFQSQFHYIQADVTSYDQIKQITQLAHDLEKTHNLDGTRLLYFSISPSLFCQATRQSARAGLVQRRTLTEPWNRLIYEKPFGDSAASAQEINTCIKEFFYEHQIYRVDHYLTKEVVNNIALLRFTNCVFEPLWNHKYIDSVQIILDEQSQVGSRASYYDHFGALADVVQNHMLELLALVCMETPQQLTGEYIRDKRTQVLSHVKVKDALLGQYEGYMHHQDVAKNSKTETFAALTLTVDTPRWQGVPFYLRTGKCLEKKQTIIQIKFKQVDCLLSHYCPSDTNYLTIQIAPEGIFSLTLNIKKPDRRYEVMPVNMEFCHSCIFDQDTMQAHAVLIRDVIAGEQSVSVRVDEIEYAWNVIERIHALRPPLYPYACGSTGPVQLKDFENKHAMRWLL